jgi:hypothetical protein
VAATRSAIGLPVIASRPHDERHHRPRWRLRERQEHGTHRSVPERVIARIRHHADDLDVAIDEAADRLVDAAEVELCELPRDDGDAAAIGDVYRCERLAGDDPHPSGLEELRSDEEEPDEAILVGRRRPAGDVDCSSRHSPGQQSHLYQTDLADLGQGRDAIVKACEVGRQRRRRHSQA